MVRERTLVRNQGPDATLYDQLNALGNHLGREYLRLTMGVVANRIRAHHFGIKGNAGPVPYSFKATYSSNWGRYSNSLDSIFNSRPKQLSLALEVGLSEQVTGIPLAFSVGAYGDFGKLYRNSAGLSLRVFYCGSRSLKR